MKRHAQVAAALDLGRHQIGTQGSVPRSQYGCLGPLGILDGYSFAAPHEQFTPPLWVPALPPVLSIWSRTLSRTRGWSSGTRACHTATLIDRWYDPNSLQRAQGKAVFCPRHAPVSRPRTPLPAPPQRAHEISQNQRAREFGGLAHRASDTMCSASEVPRGLDTPTPSSSSPAAGNFRKNCFSSDVSKG